METSVNTGLIGTRVIRMSAISPTSILDGTVELHHRINCSHPKFQSLQMITQNNDSNNTTMKYQKGGYSQNITFFYIIMYRHEDFYIYYDQSREK